MLPEPTFKPFCVLFVHNHGQVRIGCSLTSLVDAVCASDTNRAFWENLIDCLLLVLLDIVVKPK